MKNKLRSIDLFGHPISQNFDGKEMVHKTLFGGIFSVFLYAFMLFYVSLKVNTLISRNGNTLNVFDLKALNESLKIPTTIWMNTIIRYPEP